MAKKIEEYYVPWVKGIPMYISDHIELAWRKPELHRMMSNENPNAPSQKVLEAMIKYAKMANRYPDQGLVVPDQDCRDQQARRAAERHDRQRLQRSIRQCLPHVHLAGR